MEEEKTIRLMQEIENNYTIYDFKNSEEHIITLQNNWEQLKKTLIASYEEKHSELKSFSSGEENQANMILPENSEAEGQNKATNNNASSLPSRPTVSVNALEKEIGSDEPIEVEVAEPRPITEEMEEPPAIPVKKKLRI